MKKVATIFMALALLVSSVWAENADQAIKRVQLSRELTKFTRTTQVNENADAQKSNPDGDRIRILQNQMSKTHQYKTGRKIQPRLQLLKNVGGFQTSADSKGKTPIQSAEILMPMDTLALEPFLPDTIEYIAGDEFVFQIFTDDTVVLEFYVDNGDSIFGDGDFLVDLDMEGGEGIKVWDGHEADETPAGDGVFQVTINTMDIGGEGPDVFFSLQNCILYVYGWSTVSALEFTGAAYIGAPDENTSIEGTVMLAGDPPYPAADVIVWAVQNVWDDREPKEEDEREAFTGFLTMTDENGYYRIEIPDMYRDDYIVGVGDFWQLYPGYFPDPPEKEIYIGGDIPPVDFTMIQGTETIYGIVTDEAGVGIEGLIIVAMGKYGELEATTNPDGTYALSVMPGWWDVRLDEADIYGQYLIPWSQEIEVFEGGDHPVDFTLYGFDASFTGNIATADGTPLQDVEVHTDIWLGEEGGYFNWTYTDEYGNYELWVSTALQGNEIITDWNDTIQSSYWVNAWMEDALLMPDGYFNQIAPASGLDFTALIADALLSGTVFDAETGDPLWDAQVHAFMLPSDVKGGGATGGPEFWTNTDEFGNYEIPLVGGPYPGETWIIEVYWPWEWMPSVVDSLLVLSGNNYTEDYYISPPVTEGTIEGYVFDENGNGIDGARVEIYGWDSYYEVNTDGEGYFHLDGIPFGMYSATAYAEGYDPYDIYDFWVGPEPTYLEFWMGSIVGDIMVNGYVVDEANAPIEGALMMLFNWDFREPFILMTDDEGYFELMVKPGWYDFQVGANGFEAYNENLDIYSDTTLTFTLNSINLPDTLEGNVVDDMGNPLRKVFIYMEKSDFVNDTLRSIDYIGYTFTDINGHYKIALPTGEIDAMYSKEGFNQEWRRFDFPGEMPEDPVMLYPEMHVFGPELTNVADVPEDHGKRVRLTWRRAEGLEGSVKEYQVWRAIQPLNGPEPGPDMYFDWDYVTTVPVHPDMEFYNVVVPTLYDAVGDDIYWTGFVVTAIGWDNWNYWDSNILAGFSVDNLPPEIPTGLAAVGDGENISLGWEPVTNEKVKYYSIYRKTAATDFDIIGYSTSAEYVDDSVNPTETYIYSVTATDFGLNESDKSAPVSSAAVAIDDQEEVPTEFALKPNYPNPFNPETTIEFALPKNSKVTLSIYNLTGQLVRELEQNEYSAGYHRVVWNGRDSRGNAVGSGVYIYTLKAGDFSQTRKMILMR